MEKDNIEFLRRFDLASFKKAKQNMIATSDSAYGYSYRYNRNKVSNIQQYTEEEIDNIISSGDLSTQQRLSKNFFYKDGYYRQIIIYYATLLKYAGILIPHVSNREKIKTGNIQKKYYSAIDYVEKMDLSNFLANCALRALIDGSYYGVVVQIDKNNFSVLDIPSGYACSNFKDTKGNDIVEFDLSYFDTIFNKDDRKAALSSFPKFIQQMYYKWKNGKINNSWIMLPAGIGVCFPFFDGRPVLLDIIPDTLKYDKAIETEQERDAEEIKKIIVQKVPHLTDGRLLFEPDEAEEMHAAAVGMLKGNKNVSVLTTYTDVDAIISKTTSDNNSDPIERMRQNVYSKAGVSSQIFASTGSSTLNSSIKYDISFMMYLANKFSRFITNVINSIYANGSISFKYIILPVGVQNEKEYIDSSFKLASSGYSFLVPAIASGFSQKDICGIKDLENDVLKLNDRFIPLKSSYTQSEGSEDNGRPTKEQDEKAEGTIEKETSLDNQSEALNNE